MEKRTFLVGSEKVSLQAFVQAMQQKINEYAHLNEKASLDDSINYWVRTFQDIDHNAPGAFCLINPWKFEYFFVSESVRRMFNLDHEDVVANGLKASLPIFVEDHRVIMMKHIFPALNKVLIQSVDEGRSSNLQLQYQTKCRTASGAIRWFEHHLSVVKTAPDGVPQVLLKVIHDIHDIKSGDYVDFKAYYIEEASEEETVIMDERYILRDADIDISERELQILLKISEGLGTKQIADQLFISENTVKNHRANMLKKTKSANCSQLIKMASQIGLL